MTSFSKKYHEIAQIEYDEFLEHSGELVNSMNFYLGIIKRDAYNASLRVYDLASSFFSMQMDSLDQSIAIRILNNDPIQLSLGLTTAGRFGYLKSVAGGIRYSASDCGHIQSMIYSLAAHDYEAISAYCRQFEAPFKNAHPAAKGLGNCLYSILGFHPNPDEAMNSLYKCKVSQYNKATFDALDAIYRKNEDSFTEAITRMVKGYRRQDLRAMEKMVCVDAHALITLYEFKNGHLNYHWRQLGLPFDISYQNYAQDESQKVSIYDFRSQSRTISKWLVKLPEVLELEDLVAEVISPKLQSR